MVSSKGEVSTDYLTIALAVCSLSISNANYRPLRAYASNDSSVDRTAFTFLGGTPEGTLITVIDNRDGYTQYRSDIYKLPYTINSNLYLLAHRIDFTPGYIADLVTDDPKYLETAKLGRGVVRITLQKHLGEIKLKGVWPMSSSVETTVSSSFSTSLSLTGQLSNKMESGISMGDGARLSASHDASLLTGLNITWNKATSSLVDDPIVSEQNLPTGEGIAWTYEIQNPDVAGKLTYHFCCYLLFEMEKSAKEDGFKFDFHIMTQDYYWDTGMWPFGQKWKFGDTYNYDLHVDCFL